MVLVEVVFAVVVGMVLSMSAAEVCLESAISRAERQYAFDIKQHGARLT